MTPFGFIGFGEVGACLATALASTGAPVLAYDIACARKGGEEKLRKRSGNTRIGFVTIAGMATGSRVILSTVPADAAVKAATACARHLDERHFYIDLNSTLPETKREIAGIIDASGAGFAEGVILGAVESIGPRVHILTGGARAEQAAALLRRHGLNAGSHSTEIGKASAFKLLRSIFYKGTEAALMECLLMARRHGVEEELWRDIVHTMDAHSFADTGSAWIRTHATAHARRAHEMEQVVLMARETGLELAMAQAAANLFRASQDVNLAEHFETNPTDLHAVVAALDARLARSKPPRKKGSAGKKRKAGTAKQKQRKT